MKITPYKIRLILAGIVLILSTLALYGLFYPLKFLDIQFTPLVQRVIFNFSIAALCLLLGVVFLTFVFGRLYCSTICPFGILQEVLSFLRGKRKNSKQGNYGFKYLISSLAFGALVAGCAVIIRYIDPYSVFGSAFSLSLFGIVFCFAILILVLFKNRFFCTNICPVGAILGLISKFSINKIYIDSKKCVSCSMCANSCPSGCIDYKEKNIDNETCIKCLKCLSVCKKSAIKFGFQPVKFNPKRRDFMYGAGALAFLAAGYAIGLNFTKNIAKKS